MNVSENLSQNLNAQPATTPSSMWADPTRQRLMLMAGSGAMLATSLVLLNRSRLFQRSALTSRILSQGALHALGRRLADLSAEVGTKAGILQRRPLLARWLTGRRTTLNTTPIKQMQERLSHAGSEAIDTIRHGLRNSLASRIGEPRMLAEQAAQAAEPIPSTLGNSLLMLGLLATAMVAPSLLVRPQQATNP